MSRIIDNLFDIGYMDTLAGRDSALHRLDPRVKLITSLFFIATVVSFDKYSLSALMPFFIYPVVLICQGDLPAGYILKKLLIVSPFAVLIALFNPALDRSILFSVGPFGVSGGWVSFFSIVIKFFLTVSAALILISSTGFNSVCLALSKLGVPKPFVVQLLFFFRYIFVLADEAGRMFRAWSLRSSGAKAMDRETFVSFVGQLLLRALDRAERVYLAMCSRGFDGKIRMMRAMKTGAPEVVFVTGWIVFFILSRWYNIPVKIGEFITKGSL